MNSPTEQMHSFVKQIDTLIASTAEHTTTATFDALSDGINLGLETALPIGVPMDQIINALIAIAAHHTAAAGVSKTNFKNRCEEIYAAGVKHKGEPQGPPLI